MINESWLGETPAQRAARRKKEDEELRYAQSVRLARAIRNYGAGAPGSGDPGQQSPAFSYKETPAGLIDGLNRTFILNHEPETMSDHVYLNGLLQDSDPQADYAIYKNVITFYEAPPIWSKIKCTYLIK